MIIRRRNPNEKGEKTFLMHVTYTVADVRRVLQNFIKNTASEISISKTEEEIKALFLHSVFSQLPKKNAKDLADWAFDVAVSECMVLESPSLAIGRQKEYYINSHILDIRKGPKCRSKEEQ